MNNTTVRRGLSAAQKPPAAPAEASAVGVETPAMKCAAMKMHASLVVAAAACCCWMTRSHIRSPMPAMKRPARKPKWCRARPATREPTTNARQLATCGRQQQPCRVSSSIHVFPADPVARPPTGLTERVVPEFSNHKCQAVSNLRQTVLARQMVSGITPHKLAYADTEGTMEVLTRTGCDYGVRKKTLSRWCLN